ncbi:unnamed protein product, partial [Polarella glacialis]
MAGSPPPTRRPPVDDVNGQLPGVPCRKQRRVVQLKELEAAVNASVLAAEQRVQDLAATEAELLFQADGFASPTSCGAASSSSSTASASVAERSMYGAGMEEVLRWCQLIQVVDVHHQALETEHLVWQENLRQDEDYDGEIQLQLAE